MDIPLTIAFVGLLLGVVARTAIPFLRKLRTGVVEDFGRKYLYSSIAAFIIALIVAALAFPQITTTDGLASIFAANFMVGFGMNSLINELMAAGEAATK